MGVKGLMAALKRRMDGVRPEPLPTGATLVIDGDGWAFDVLDLSADATTGALFGGDYLDLDSTVRREVRALEEMGLRLVFYFGGGSDGFKDGTLLKRTLQREEGWMNLYTACRAKSVQPKDCLPIPTMGIEQVIKSLQDMNISIVDCEEESDQEIGKAVRAANVREGAETHFCYGRDSDFLAMKDCPYIEFGTLAKTAEAVAAVVFRRASTAVLLGLPSEQLLVELCILCGNDFTSEFSQSIPSQYVESPPYDEPKSNASLVASNVEWLLSKGSFIADSVSNTSLNIAIKYSRAFYELEDMDVFRIELQNYRESIGYSEPVAQMSMSLSRQERDRLSVWAKQNDSPGFALPGKSVFMYLASKQSGPDGRPVALNGSDAFISQDHMSALLKMLDDISDPSQVYSCNPLRKPAKEIMFPLWKDVIAVHAYQLLVLRLMNDQCMTCSVPLLHPLRNFDGSLFYAHLNCIRNTTAMNTTPPTAPRVEALAENFTKLNIGEEGRAIDEDNAPNAALPIDAHQEEILFRINRDRVTIIHGETGCGKSSRVPAMILEHARETGTKCKMMVSQPRRIAASSLMKRLRDTLGDEVGMRMGHGVKDETSDTKLFFVTTGYLVRLLAYHPDYFDSHSHLIIDEVHERSVDGDVLCYLARRLLERHNSLKLVLMSATMHINLYQDYFAPTASMYYGDLQCLSVGARRFPLEMFHTDDMCSKAGIPHVFRPLCENINKRLANVKSSDIPDPQFIKQQYALVNHIVREVVEPGTGVLVFVSGIFDITEISDFFSNDEKYVVVPIHSEIPFEDQELAFEPVKSHEIKVVIATNAAESSITLPDVDVVICLGTHKAVRYDSATGRVQLANQFISKASACQRAGRTGRTRPGKVYRLYSSHLFEKMNDHDLPEVVRKPLEDVILNLRAMLEDSSDFTGVVPILESLLESPKIENIRTSFDQLYKFRMISSPGDEGELTPVGRMAGNLPVDLHLSRMIALGIALGIGSEAVAIAAALTIPKTPFRTAHHLIHKDPDDYNEIIQRSFLAAVRADGGMYSHPIMLVNLLCEWRALSKVEGNQRRIHNWVQDNNVVRSRMQQFDGVAKNIARTVAAVLSRIGNRLEARRIPKYDLSSWLAMQDDLESGNDRDSDGDTESSSLPYLDANVDEDLALDIEFLRDEINESNSDVVSKLSSIEPLKIDFDEATEEEKQHNACRLNMCRLILAWSSDGYLLHIKQKTKVPADYYNTVRLGGNVLSSVQCSSLFPEGVPAEMRGSVGSLIYDGKIRGSNLMDIMNRLCNVGHAMADSRHDSSSMILERWRNDPEVDQPLPIIWISLALPGPGEGKTAVFLALPDARAESFLAPIFSRGSFEDTGEEIGLYHVFGVDNVSKKELKNLGLSRKALGKVLTMAIPSSGNAKLTAVGCEPCYADLRYIFEAEEDEKVAAKKQSASDDFERILPHGITVQTFDHDKTLFFDHESNFPGNPYHFPNSLIQDSPIGMRLFNAYKSSRFKDKYILVKKQPRIGFSNDNYYPSPGKSVRVAPELVPGSAEWLKAKQDSSTNSNSATSDADITTIIAASPDFNWASCKVFNNGSIARKGIYLPSAAPVSAATHTGSEPVFGTAFNVMDIFPGNKQRCDGISLFPVGTKWITLAFECIGFNTSVISDLVDSMPSKHDKITPREKKLVRMISELLADQVQELPVAFNSDLTAAVKVLFAPWGGQIRESNGVKTAVSDEQTASAAAASGERPDSNALHFRNDCDYAGLLYKEVKDNYGAGVADTITYSTVDIRGQKTVTVSFIGGDVTYSESSDSSKKAVAKRMAAFRCLCSLRDHANIVGDIPKKSDTADLKPKVFTEPNFRDLLKELITEGYGKDAASTVEYSFTAKKLLVNGELSFSLDGYITVFSFKVTGMKSKKDAKEKLAEDACDMIHGQLASTAAPEARFLVPASVKRTRKVSSKKK